MPDETGTDPININPFIDSDAPTYAEVMVEISADQNLNITKRRDMASALRRILQLLDLDPARTPASVAAIKKKLAGLHHAQAGISAKTLANMKSNVLAALRHVTLTNANLRRSGGQSPSWQLLWDTIENEQNRWRLSRLSRFCSASGVEPDEVDDAVIESLHQALVEESFVKDPEATVRATIYAWNRSKDETDGWPSTNLSRRPNRQEKWTIKLDQFPASFQRDLDKWISRLRGDDPLADDAVPQPLRPATLKHRTFQARMFASALVHRNMPPERITDLSILVEPSNYEAALRYMLERNGNQKTEAIYGCATAIKAIAEHYVKVDPNHLKELQRLCSRIKVKTRGLTAKNRRRLRQFDDPANVAAFLQLPDQLETLAGRTRGRDAAVSMQMAIAIDLLTMCPLRIKNLANLKLNDTIYWTRPGRRGTLMVSIPPESVKNGQPIEFEVHKEIVPRIVRYLDTFRRQLFDDPGDWLFPGLNGEAKKSGTLGRQIKHAIQKHAGLDVPAHSIRHVTAKLYLKRQPAAFEVVRLVLGHASSDTTIEHYTGLENKAAVAHFDEMILQQREESVPSRSRPNRRSPK